MTSNFLRAVGLAAAFTVGAGNVQGQSPSAAPPSGLSLELNKLEPLDKACRAYFVIDNAGDKNYAVLKLDLVLFQPDGVIGRRVTLDLAPIKSAKQVVKQFDFDALACDKVGRVLINDVVDCKTDAGPVADCLSGLPLKSLVNGVGLGK